MPTLRIPLFGGMMPAVDDNLLPDNAAANAVNTWLASGVVRPLPVPYSIHTMGSGKTAAYRIPNDLTNPTYLYDSTWLEFANSAASVVKAPVFNDTHSRYYFASPSTNPQYNSLARIIASSAPYLLGIPQPGAIGVSSTGGTGAADTRSYVVTWVSVFGEEGPPSAAVTLTGKVDDTWTVTLPAVAADNKDGPDRDLDYTRIYRTVTSASGVTTYFLVSEEAITATSYADTSLDAAITGNSSLESTSWTAPPTDLQGFVMMPNGIVVGWRENELWFSEPYRPHAWPAAYVLTLEYHIVGLGVTNQTLVACTQGYPVTASGAAPEFITTSKITSFEPCTGQGSILSTPEGVYYTSPNGLILVVPGQATNITRGLVTRDKWRQLITGTSMRSARFGTAYYGFGTSNPGVFYDVAFDTDGFAQEELTGSYNGVLVDLADQRIALTKLTSADSMTNVFTDPWSGEVLLIRDGEVLALDISSASPTYDSCIWKSKRFQLPVKANFGAAKVYFTVPATTATQAVAADNTLIQTLSSDQYGLLRVYADDELVATRELRTSGGLIRLPSGFKSDFWQFELETRVLVNSLHIGSTVKDLRNV